MPRTAFSQHSCRIAVLHDVVDHGAEHLHHTLGSSEIREVAEAREVRPLPNDNAVHVSRKKTFLFIGLGLNKPYFVPHRLHLTSRLRLVPLPVGLSRGAVHSMRHEIDHNLPHAIPGFSFIGRQATTDITERGHRRNLHIFQDIGLEAVEGMTSTQTQQGRHQSSALCFDSQHLCQHSPDCCRLRIQRCAEKHNLSKRLNAEKLIEHAFTHDCDIGTPRDTLPTLHNDGR
mmetsp:Transcript_45811/g.141148  ORF Transcript_45811/g.141148 Transcript_45811/m.141148 type:complete len:230 (-) Transcript_45811:187-876(-)